MYLARRVMGTYGGRLRGSLSNNASVLGRPSEDPHHSVTPTVVVWGSFTKGVDGESPHLTKLPTPWTLLLHLVVHTQRHISYTEHNNGHRDVENPVETFSTS